jgi:riboflavin synthase
MFTGIVEERGEVVAVDDLGDAVRLSVRGPLVTSDVRPGDSIAVNGCCLTVVEHAAGVFTTDVMRESLLRTSLSAAVPGAVVNLERAVTATARMGGHLVQGHVDGTGTVRSRQASAHWDVLSVEVPAGLARYLAPKGSVAVDGVSLTVVDVVDGDGHSTVPSFTVSLIPTTLAATTLGIRRAGDLVNLEVDVIAKYVERLLAHPAACPVEHPLPTAPEVAR